MNWAEFGDASRLREIKIAYLSLEETKQAIEELLEKKLKFDKRSLRERGPRKSMAQFMFRFFQERSDKSAQTIEQAYNFLQSLNVHQADADVALFALILRNEIEEEFAETHFQIKDRIEELLRFEVQRAHPESRPKELDSHVEQVKKSGLDPAVARTIVDKMYKDDHPNKSRVLVRLGLGADASPVKLKRFSTQHPRKKIAKTRSGSSKKSLEQRPQPASHEKPKVAFQSLERVILKSEIRSHREFLGFVRVEFRKLDPGNFGFIRKARFAALLSVLFRNHKTVPEVEKLLKKRKDFSPAIVTFSDVVGMLAKKTVHSGSEIKSGLESIFDKLQR